MESRIPQQAGTSFLIGVTPVVLIKHLINTCLQSTLGLRTPRYFGHPLLGHQGSTSLTETTPYIPRVDCNTTLLGGGETESRKRSLHTHTDSDLGQNSNPTSLSLCPVSTRHLKTPCTFCPGQVLRPGHSEYASNVFLRHYVGGI